MVVRFNAEIGSRRSARLFFEAQAASRFMVLLLKFVYFIEAKVTVLMLGS